MIFLVFVPSDEREELSFKIMRLMHYAAAEFFKGESEKLSIFENIKGRYELLCIVNCKSCLVI